MAVVATVAADVVEVEARTDEPAALETLALDTTTPIAAAAPITSCRYEHRVSLELDSTGRDS